MRSSLLKATELKVSYGNEPPVFRGLDFFLSPGEHLGLSGPSGSGKTTLLRLCAGLFGFDHNPAVGGRLTFNDDLDLLDKSDSLRSSYRQNAVSMITENPRAGLHPQRTVGQSWNHYNVDGTLATSLTKLGIADAARIIRSYPHELSGGEAQRVRLAFALSKHPSILLLESPTAALDNLNAELVWEQVRLAKSRGAAILHVDHNLALIEKYADQQIYLGASQDLASNLQIPEINLGDVVLAAAEVSVKYGDFSAVKSAQIALKAGEFVALLGPSGSGKSSLGKALAGIQPANGTLEVEGKVSAFAKTPYDHVDTRIQYIWQEPRMSMNPKFTVAKTLQESIGTRKNTPEQLLKLVDLGVDKLSQNTLTLSTGEQQRLAIARALAVNPNVLVCDEITSGLDTLRSNHVLQTLHRLREELSIAVLFITHDEHLAEAHANRSVHLRNGELI